MYIISLVAALKDYFLLLQSIHVYQENLSMCCIQVQNLAGRKAVFVTAILVNKSVKNSHVIVTFNYLCFHKKSQPIV